MSNSPSAQGRRLWPDVEGPGPAGDPKQRLRNAMDSIRLKRGAGEYTDQEAARAAVLAEQEAAASQMPAGQAGAYDIDSAEGYADHGAAKRRPIPPGRPPGPLPCCTCCPPMSRT